MGAAFQLQLPLCLWSLDLSVTVLLQQQPPKQHETKSDSCQPEAVAAVVAETATELGAEEEAEAEAAQQTHQGHSYSHSQAQLLQPLSILHRRVLFTVCSQIKLRIKAETERERTQESESDIYTYVCVSVCVCVCSYLPLYLGEFAGSRNEFSTILLYRVVFSFFLFGFQCRAYSLTCSRSCSLSLSRSLSFSLCACTFSQLSMPCCKSISCLCVCVSECSMLILRILTHTP